MTFNWVKEVYDQGWNKIIAVIKNEANPLYIVDPVYYPSAEIANLSESEGHVEGIAFAGMADHESQEE